MKALRRTLWTLALVGVLGCLETGNAGSSSDCVEGSGVPKTVERSVDAFHAVAVDGAFEVIITGGKRIPLSLTADDNLIAHIKTEVTNGTLHIRPQRSICAKSAMRVSVGTDALDAVSTSGSNDVSLENLVSDHLDLQMDGSGSMSAAGRAVAVTATIKGAADLKARELKAQTVRVEVTGAGDAEVYASKSLKAIITGAGDVAYHGSPPDVQQSITGWGEVHPAE